MPETNARRTWSYDGKGINGPDQYRRRMFTARAADDAEDQKALDDAGNLAAAAPELLACAEWLAEIAGERAVNDYVMGKRYGAIAEQARAAIAQARGATPGAHVENPTA